MLKLTLLLFGFCLTASELFAAAIVNSKHNLAQTDGVDQICVYCHIAHNANEGAPLWNRNFTTDAKAFRLYSAVNSANVTFSSGFTSDSVSLLCMCCHDGTTSTDDVIHNKPPTSAGVITGPANLGMDLSNSHPVNFQVSVFDTQSDLWVSNNAFTGAYMGRNGGVNAVAGQYNTKYPLYVTDVERKGSRSLECPSCHTVHDPTFSPFLRDTMDGSKLCLGCHNK